MKLRNKKTGEIGTPRVDYQELYVDTENGYTYHYKSLQKMCEEWEDYEEPKEYYCIDWTEHGGVYKTKEWDPRDEFNKKIGNCFDTRKEAEQAIEKLKAWKRLKDKGFRFTGFTHKDRGRLDELEIYCQLGERPEDIEDMEDVDVLFGGEE